jgi:DNA-binding NarL/FixJ family response regulator
MEEELLKKYLETINLRLIRLEQEIKFLVSTSGPRKKTLTSRQQAVLELKKQGLLDKQVAEQLGISRSYVSTIVGTLRKKGYSV